MPEPIDYQSTALPTAKVRHDWYGWLSAMNGVVLATWLVWGSFQLVDAFYSGPGNAPRGPMHRPWWYVLYGGGTAIAIAGLALGMIGMWSPRGNRRLSLIGVLVNLVGLVGYASAIPYRG